MAVKRMHFQDRVEAGRRLASELVAYRDEAPLVLGLPRGGVVLAYEVARALDAPLDVCIRSATPILPAASQAE